MEQAIDIKRHSLVQLCAMLALVLSKIFDQVGGRRGLFNSEGGELGLQD